MLLKGKTIIAIFSSKEDWGLPCEGGEILGEAQHDRTEDEAVRSARHLAASRMAVPHPPRVTHSNGSDERRGTRKRQSAEQNMVVVLPRKTRQ